MSKHSILIVEDDPDIVELLEFNLHREGYDLLTANNGSKGFELAKKKTPSLIVLDLMLPETDGLEVCRLLKQDDNTRDIPIIMLTAKGEESDIIVGLNMGADDYVTKPFSPKEFVARVKAVLRRIQQSTTTSTSDTVKIGELEMDNSRVRTTLNGNELTLTRSEFKLLFTLASNPGRVFTRDQLLDHVRGENITIVDRNIDVHIASLRRKLEPHSDYIVTVRGIGYRFIDK